LGLNGPTKAGIEGEKIGGIDAFDVGVCPKLDRESAQRFAQPLNE
jgi:hypothetical protein